MSWQFAQLSIPLAVSGVLGLVVAGLLWRERPKAGASWFALAAVSVALWGLGQAVAVSSTEPSVRTLANAVTVVGMVSVPPFALLFALAYTGRSEWVSRPLLAVLLGEPIVMSALALLNHDLMLTAELAAPARVGTTLFDLFGPVMWAHHVYGYGVLFATEYLLAHMFLRSRNVYRKRSFFFLALLGLSHVCEFLAVAGLSPTPGLTLTPLAFLLFGALSLLALVSYRTFEFLPLQRALSVLGTRSKNLTPIARERAIEKMPTGFIVMDHAGRIVDINPMGKRMLGSEDDRVVGKEIRTVVPPEVFVDGEPGFYEAIDDGGHYSGIWVETPSGEQRCFDARVTNLGEKEGAGYLALVQDVTERERRKRRLREQNQELKRQNDQLESFANVVSHDLRNPLSVADGRLKLLGEETDSEHVTPARDAIDRMGQIVDDVLAMARLGQSVSDTERVALDDLAADAWANVDTGQATLEIEADRAVECDRSRLLQVFENFFRNAIEHGRADVTVTVGALEDGFFVADDGPGIPAGQREEVLQEGFSTDADGTGFGLSIVNTIVEAHGWEIAVTESVDGGARFEITGDVFAPEPDRHAVA